VQEHRHSPVGIEAENAAEILLEIDPSLTVVKRNDLPPAQPPIDYYLWDLYASVSGWYGFPGAEDKRKKKREAVLHAIEEGNNETAEIADFISKAVLRRHLETMSRLGIEYDFLPRESEIVRLHFWELAFEQLVKKGVLYFETEGKNKDCWVMSRVGVAASKREKGKGPDEDAKVIVRSNGTLTYVAKDIAYHLWKFGLLKKDFGYKKFCRYCDRQEAWISAEFGDTEHPHFGNADAIYNVIDSRQADPQRNVVGAIKAMGYKKQAANFHHFSYEMVALTPSCAEEMGYPLSDEERKRSYIEVSGRKGFGVKADDLLDRLFLRAELQASMHNPDMPVSELREVASEVAVGALRYFMLRWTRNAIIPFDFTDALKPEGETGPYAQYAIVRATNIFRKAGCSPEQLLKTKINLFFLEEEGSDEIWRLWLTVGQLDRAIQQCVDTNELTYIAKFGFQLAQQFHNFYHKHHILTETDEAKKSFLLATAAVVRRALIQSLELMGIGAPSVM